MMWFDNPDEVTTPTFWSGPYGDQYGDTDGDGDAQDALYGYYLFERGGYLGNGEGFGYGHDNVHGGGTGGAEDDQDDDCFDNGITPGIFASMSPMDNEMEVIGSNYGIDSDAIDEDYDD